MRLFLGTFLEPNLLDKIPFETIESQLKLKPIKRNYLHLTWVFIGEVEELKLNKLEAILSKNINIFSNLTFKSRDLVLWPPGRPPRLVVCTGDLLDDIGNEKVNLPLNNLVDNLKEICKPDTKRSFQPHITIARIKKNIFVDKNKALPKLNCFTWNINEVSLIRSVLNDSGSTYTKIKNWKMG